MRLPNAMLLLHVLSFLALAHLMVFDMGSGCGWASYHSGYASTNMGSIVKRGSSLKDC